MSTMRELCSRLVIGVSVADADIGLFAMLLFLTTCVRDFFRGCGLSEVLLVVFGEAAVVVEASFDLGYPGGGGAEGRGDGCDGEAVPGALSAQVRSVGHGGRVDEQFVDFSCDVAFGGSGGFRGRFCLRWCAVWRRAMLRSSMRRRIMAMRHRALFAQRLPPRLSRCRRIVPEDASMGLAPHRAAKEASLRRRSGLSPAAVSRAAAVSGPTPQAPSSAGLACAHKRRSSVLRLSGLRGEGPVAPCQAAQCALGCAQHGIAGGVRCAAGRRL